MGNSGVDLGAGVFDTKVLPLPDGGAIVGYLLGGTGKIVRIDAAGNFVWDNPIEITSGVESYSSIGEMALLENDEVMILLHSKSVSWTLNSNFWAQKIDLAGNMLWTSPVQVSNQATAYNRRYQTWVDENSVYLGYYGSTGNRFDSFLQKINADGTLPWGINGADFSTNDANYEMETRIAIGDDVVWSIVNVSDANQNQFGVNIQKFNKETGERLLDDNAKVVFNLGTNQTAIRDLQLVDGNPLFLGATNISNGVNEIQLYTSLLNENGDFEWEDPTVIIASTPNNKSRVKFTKNVAGQSVAVWAEDRGEGSLAYAQNFVVESGNNAPENDECSNAIALSCGDSITASTEFANDSGNTASADVFYTHTGNGEAQYVTISLCGSSFDTYLSVWSDCSFENLITENDDSLTCDFQSELTFYSDGVSTYYIQVEGYSAEDLGEFTLNISCAAIDFYCEPLLDCTGNDNITRVEFQEITNDSDCGENGYSDYSEEFIATVSAGNSYPIAVTVGDGWDSESVSVWIDFNNNFLFEEEEFYFIGTGSTNVVSGEISIPEGTEDGTYRMRVRVAAVGADFATYDLACDESQIFGETEDYGVLVDNTFATNDLNNSNRLKIYPNPVTDILNVKTDENVVKYMIYNVEGKLIQEVNGEFNQLNVNGLNQGAYLLQLNYENGKSQSIKFLKK